MAPEQSDAIKLIAGIWKFGRFIPKWRAQLARAGEIPHKVTTFLQSSQALHGLQLQSMIDMKCGAGGRVHRNMGPCEIQSFEPSVWGLKRQSEHPECLTQLMWAWVHVFSAKLRQFPSQICPISPTLCWNQMYFWSTSSYVHYTFAEKRCCDRAHRHSPDKKSVSKP